MATINKGPGVVVAALRTFVLGLNGRPGPTWPGPGALRSSFLIMSSLFDWCDHKKGIYVI